MMKQKTTPSCAKKCQNKLRETWENQCLSWRPWEEQRVSKFFLSSDYNCLLHNSAPETRPEHIYNTSSYILYFSAKNEIALPEQYFNRNGSKKNILRDPWEARGGISKTGGEIYITYGETHPFSVVNNVWMWCVSSRQTNMSSYLILLDSRN